MVILKNLPFRDKLNLAMMIEYDTKKVIQEHARLINRVSSSVFQFLVSKTM